MRFLIFLICLSCLHCKSRAQNHEKIVVNARDSVSGYYLAVKPAGDVHSVVVLLDGFGGSAESVMVESSIPNIAYANNILTVAASMGPKIYADSTVISKLNHILKDVINRYKVSPDRFVIGGFSAGGTISLRYAELCKDSPSKYPINPKGVFTVDSPVDLFDLWNFFGKQIAKNYSDVAVEEAQFVSKLMIEEHGDPTLNVDKYRKLTPFYYEEKNAGNERFLKDVAVRVYHEVDVVWQLQNRRRSVHEANYLNSSELILRLMLMGNKNAEFVNGREGRRTNGVRHPHSWNIVDEIEFVQWVKRIVP